MAQIQRPTKQGNATTYQGKVAAGYTTILASEMDADLDLMYSAWNQGVDASNIQPGVITGNMLAAGAITTRELQDGGIQTVDIGDGQVTTPKLADLSVTTGKIADAAISDAKISGVSWSKISTGAVQNGQVPVLARGLLLAEGGGFDVQGNTPQSPSYDNTKPSYLVRLDYSGDSFDVWRAPPPGTAFVRIFQVTGTGVTYATLSNGAIARAQLAVNAIQGNTAAVGNPTSFNLSTANVWTTYATLPALTTRGATVHLYAAPSLSATMPISGGSVAARWLRDGGAVIGNSWQIAAGASVYMPLPGINWIDQGAAAGTHTYAYQVLIGTGGAILASGTSDGGFVAYALG